MYVLCPVPGACFHCRLELWEESGYCSANIGAESDGEEDEFEEEEEEKEGCDLGYLRGDVTHPQCLGDEDALILHCVGMCANTPLS